MKEPQQILTEAIQLYKPRQIVCLFSGGYDSMCATHLAHELNTHGVPMATWAIDTKLSADSWVDYVTSVSQELHFTNFGVYDNQKGFDSFVKFVSDCGAPYTKSAHTYCFRHLKERAMDRLHMMYKKDRQDKTLFLSGMRRAESRERSSAEEYHRAGKSNKIFVSPIVSWSNEQVAIYRSVNDLPDNPFYSTVKGSGDCQCNWGNFIDLETLQHFSPHLASGNVALLDEISKANHGYGWDGIPSPNVAPGQLPLLPDCDLNGPFLCSGCSRKGNKHLAESVMLQRGII